MKKYDISEEFISNLMENLKASISNLEKKASYLDFLKNVDTFNSWVDDLKSFYDRSNNQDVNIDNLLKHFPGDHD